MSGRFVGWTFVGCAAILVAAQIARTSQGYSATLYEWPVVLFIAALFLLVGAANLSTESSRSMTAAVLAGCALFYIGVGVAALVAPDSMTVTTPQLGPRTPDAARVAGLLMVAAGFVFVGGAWCLGRRKSADKQGPGH